MKHNEGKEENAKGEGKNRKWKKFKFLYVFPLEIICFSWHLPPTPPSDYTPKPNEDTNKDKNYITQ